MFESVDSDVHADSSGDSQEMALRTAEKLLKELKPKPGQQMLSYQLLQGMLALATKKKQDIERVKLCMHFWVKQKRGFILGTERNKLSLYGLSFKGPSRFHDCCITRATRKGKCWGSLRNGNSISTTQTNTKSKKPIKKGCKT